MYAKAHRRVAEMEEIAAFAEQDSATNGIYTGIADFYEALAQDQAGPQRDIETLKCVSSIGLIRPRSSHGWYRCRFTISSPFIDSLRRAVQLRPRRSVGAGRKHHPRAWVRRSPSRQLNLEAGTNSRQLPYRL
jgi:hypothetical protein